MSGFLGAISWLLKIGNQDIEETSKEKDIIQRINQMKLEETESTTTEKDRNSRGSWDWFVSTSPIEIKYHIDQLYED